MLLLSIIVVLIWLIIAAALMIAAVYVIRDGFGGLIDYAFGALLFLFGIGLLIAPFVYDPLTEGEIISKGHTPETCRQVPYKVGKITNFRRRCRPAHDYIIIQDEDKESKIKVENKDNYEVGDYYKGK